MTVPHSEQPHVDALLARFRRPDACAAELLCDRHPPERVAYRILHEGASLESFATAPERVTYGELRDESERFAAALRGLGVGPGDRVATLMGKSRQFLVALMGIWRLGAVHVPLFTAFAPSAIALRLLGSQARVVVCDAAQQHKLAPGDDIPASASWQLITAGGAGGDHVGEHVGEKGALDFAALLAQGGERAPAAAVGGEGAFIHIYTSGTTGNPKGVVVPLWALAAFQAYAEYGLDLRAEDTFWCAADAGWAYGLYYGVIATFLTGAESLMLPGAFAPEATLRVLAEQGVTNFAAAPTVYRALRNAGLKPPAPLRLRCASSAGEPLTPEVNEWAQRELGVAVYDHYGQTETGMVINNHHHPALERPLKPGAMGRGLPGWQPVILHAERDEEVGPNQLGRVAMRLADSPLAWFTGYHADPAKSAEKFTADGRWYVTGDAGLVDDEGYFRFSARDDDVIIMAGYRIGPFELESTLASHPAVAESAVVGVPDAVRGEVVEAFVVLAGGHAAAPELAQALQQWVKTRYAAHAYPRTIHFIDALPKTPSGKTQRFLLKQRRLQELQEGEKG